MYNMLRKDTIEDKLGQLQLTIDRLRSSLVVPQDPGDIGTPIQTVVRVLEQVQNQIDQIVNLIELED